MEGAIYMLNFESGEWDSHNIRTIFADADLDVVREWRDELKRRATTQLVDRGTGGPYGDLVGLVAYHMEMDDCTMHIDRLPLGCGQEIGRPLTVSVDRDEWGMPYENMTTELWNIDETDGDLPRSTDAVSLERYAVMAEQYEQKFENR